VRNSLTNLDKSFFLMWHEQNVLRLQIAMWYVFVMKILLSIITQHQTNWDIQVRCIAQASSTQFKWISTTVSWWFTNHWILRTISIDAFNLNYKTGFTLFIKGFVLFFLYLEIAQLSTINDPLAKYGNITQ